MARFEIRDYPFGELAHLDVTPFLVACVVGRAGLLLDGLLGECIQRPKGCKQHSSGETKDNSAKARSSGGDKPPLCRKQR